MIDIKQLFPGPQTIVKTLCDEGVCPKGPKGEPGPLGPTGPPGDKGRDGDSGSKGGSDCIIFSCISQIFAVVNVFCLLVLINESCPTALLALV